MQQIFDNTSDTICAISTPAGVGGIAVARVSGPDALAVADRIWRGRPLSHAATHTAHLGTVLDSMGHPLDQAVATVFRGPKSFTGQDTVEISVHGSRYVQRELISALTAAGSRLALPGEFTRRAFLSGNIDLTQAEAVADIIASESRAQHRIAISQLKGSFASRISSLREQLVEVASLLELELDFSEEDVEFASRARLRELADGIHRQLSDLRRSYTAGNSIKDGIPVAIVGPTNAGKSSLLNALTDDDRAIVSDIHGTTRDTIEEILNIGDYRFRLIDTAGIRHSDDAIERIGIERSRRAIDKARIIIVLNDITRPLDTGIIRSAHEALNRQDPPGHLIIALNKADLTDTADGALAAAKSFAGTLGTAVRTGEKNAETQTIAISAVRSDSLRTIQQALLAAADSDASCAVEDIMITNLRQANALSDASAAIRRVIDAIDANLTGDLIAIDLRQAIDHLAALTGAISSQDILTSIFSRFCIGK